MKEYRNSIRSKRVLKEAIIEILDNNDISKVTVKMVCDKSDLSRNTFYHHYADVYAILEEIQDDLKNKFVNYLDVIIKDKDINQSGNFFLNVFSFIGENKRTINVLLKNDTGGKFVETIKAILIERALKNGASFNICDNKGYLIFLDIIFSGVVDLIKLSINNRLDLSVEELAHESNRIFINGFKAYTRG